MTIAEMILLGLGESNLSLFSAINTRSKPRQKMPDPAPHIHEREDEDFYILDSGLNCQIGERTRPQARLCSPRVALRSAFLHLSFSR